MHMLADQKQTQGDMQLIMEGVQTLVYTAVIDTTISEINELLISENCSHAVTLQFLEAKNIVPDVFRGLRGQHTTAK